ncbi:MAG: SDR family oxidoreductase [Ghiorsea sp.]
MRIDKIPTCILILGCGYVGTKFAVVCLNLGIKVLATVRDTQAQAKLQSLGIDAVCNDNPATLPTNWLNTCDAILDSIPLSYHANRQPFASQPEWLSLLLERTPSLVWAGYLSATSVYSDSQGQWIDENSPTMPSSKRGLARLEAEQAWLSTFKAAEVFRLAGIYGNERNILSKLQAGNYKTVAWHPAHYSNRIHADDIVAALIAAMHKPQAQRIINISDDAPCSHAEYACDLAQSIAAPHPIILSEQDAQTQLSPTFLDFFRDNKRISNKKLHQELLLELKYPDFKSAIPSLIAGQPNL